MSPFKLRSSFSFWMTATLCYTIEVSCLNDPNLPPIFYPFGTDVGDAVAPVNDDGFTSATLISTWFPFFNTSRRLVYVSTNGAISFDQGISSYTPTAFPLPVGSSSMICPYWSDIDTRKNDGRIYYRESSDPQLLRRTSQDIQTAYSRLGFSSFEARWLFIATWHNVTYFGGGISTPVQSFQAVLLTNGIYSFAMFNYGSLKWTTGTASGGNATNGLGGTPAQVGFNAGDGITFYAVEWSRTSRILQVASQSNIGVQGRWIFRVDQAQILSPDCSGQLDACQAYQVKNALGQCVDIAPSFGCPILSGPVVKNRLWVEFYCTVPTNVTNSSAQFEITFLLDNKAYNDVPVFTVDVNNLQATLHERYLTGKLGKWITCSVTSFWSTRSSNRSRPAPSKGYWAGIRASTYRLSVSEGETEPAKLYLMSTIPITCNVVSSKLCSDWLMIQSTEYIAVRQRYPGASTVSSCSYNISEADWNSDQSFTLNVNAPLEVRAKIDPFVTAPRLNYISFWFPENRMKTVNGLTYPNIWNNYSLPLISVYHYDRASSSAVCSSSGDPRITTFDGKSFSVYASGQFIYARSRNGLPVEVHVRHWPCNLAMVACVCGVALREDQAILAVDMCQDGILHFITHGSENLQNESGIFRTTNGNSYKILMPSGNKILLYAYSWGMNIHIYINGFNQTEGLCGSFDENRNNDLVAQGNPTVRQTVETIVESWRIPIGYSLFDGYLSFMASPASANVSLRTYCQCTGLLNNTESAVLIGSTTVNACGGPAVSDQSSSSWEPNRPVVVSDVRQVNQASRGRRSTNETVIRSSNIDVTYNSSAFQYNSSVSVSPSWPTANGVTLEMATCECRSRILNATVLGSACYRQMADKNITQTIIQKCIDDVQITGDFVMWSADKIPEIRKACIDAMVAIDRSSDNTTSPSDIIRLISNEVTIMTRSFCQPVDCSGHGSCVNGQCTCTDDYLGSACAVSKSVSPSIVRLLGSTDCDIRSQLCQSVILQTMDVADVATLIAKVDVIYDIITNDPAQTYLTSLDFTSPNTTLCYLPMEPLNGFSIDVNKSIINNSSDSNAVHPVFWFVISLSNDGQRFGNTRRMRVFDSLCMECSSTSCTQLPNTCKINGYCYESSDVNPFNDCYRCQPTVATDKWTLTNATGCFVSTVTTHRYQPTFATDKRTLTSSGSLSISKSISSSVVKILLSSLGMVLMVAANIFIPSR